MSRDFRPVVETWGPNSAIFVESDTLTELLTSLALASFQDSPSSSPVMVTGYGENDVFWIENGNKFLDYVDSKTVEEIIASNREIVAMDEVQEIRSLLQNIKALSPDWRKFVDPKGGALRFYIDQC